MIIVILMIRRLFRVNFSRIFLENVCDIFPHWEKLIVNEKRTFFIRNVFSDFLRIYMNVLCVSVKKKNETKKHLSVKCSFALPLMYLRLKPGDRYLDVPS